MYRKLCLAALLAILMHPPGFADPIHAIPDGAYWHHGSGWVFAGQVGDFVRVGVPQDVAGSEDAVAHYARVEDGVRQTAAVDVYRADSAAAGELETRSAQPSSDAVFSVSSMRALPASRIVYDADTATPVGVYLIDAGEWRVRIRIVGTSLEAMDEFARNQRWETLGTH